MYTGLKHLHSGLRYVVLILLILAIVTAIGGLLGKKSYTEGNRKLNLFTLIATHVQLLVGLFLYALSTMVTFNDMGTVMRTANLRYWTVEHISMMVVAVILITIGHAKSKKGTTAVAKHKSIAIFYTIAFVIIMAAILMAVNKGFITFWGF
ncbi:cytochrome B [Olivibacter sp. SDN3]|uniref:cytochrome B n=1 Tax=Olivibacter sp. SDN3 TaxID=2764720 RepID=UPI001651869D|nr:cytochrome B [Olivibacter sp. SDN3]QNL51303.1 cytochrome B [Olivibacter sp. SDN3]